MISVISNNQHLINCVLSFSDLQVLTVVLCSSFLSKTVETILTSISVHIPRYFPRIRLSVLKFVGKWTGNPKGKTILKLRDILHYLGL